MDKVSKTEIACGRFQVTLVFLTQMTRFCTVWGLYIMMFGNYQPPWRCAVDGQSEEMNFTALSKDSSLAADFTLNLTHITGRRNTSSSPVVKNPNSSSVHYDGSCQAYPSCHQIEFQSGSSTLVTEFDLICDKAWVTSLIISVEMFALIPGAYFGGQIGERFGRKFSLYTSTAILCVSIFVAVFSYNWEMYAALSFFIGLGGGGILSTASVFTMEFLNSWWRGTFTSVPMWNIALVLFTLLVICVKDWKLIHIASAVISGLTFLGVFWVPESVRWLDVHGKKDKAEKVTIRIYKTNNLNFPNKSLLNVIKDKAITSKKEVHKTYLDLFRNRYVRSITIKASIAWATSHIAYTSLGYGIKSLPGDYYTNAIIASVSEVPVILSIGPLANRFGRRQTTIVFLSLALISCGAIVAIHYSLEGDSKSLGITISALIAKAFAAAVWCILITMSLELYPTIIRNVGYGFLNLVSGLGGIIAPYLIPQDPSWFGVCFSVMTFVLAMCMVVTIALPETKDRLLADVMPNSDEEGAAQLSIAEKDRSKKESILVS